MAILTLTASLALALISFWTVQHTCRRKSSSSILLLIKNCVVKENSTSKAALHTGTKRRRYPRLSRLSSSLKPSYDVVVIGSGYGSGVAASRFARAGKTVCVLERGAEKWPGEYPHTASEAMKEYEVSGQVYGRSFRVGKRAGLYQTIKGEGQDVLIGCGLGGTSLINAGVFLEADERTLQGRDWPLEIRNDGLNEYYQRAKQMLEPTPYPSAYPTPIKLSTLEIQARGLGLQDKFFRPPLTTSFSRGSNKTGVQMQASTGSGNECTGTNDGSKNSILATYLADAWASGAELFCEVDVKYVKKRGEIGGYAVFFEVPGANGVGRLSWVIAKDLLILGAGAIGTSAILLRSRLRGLSTSPILGQRISGNGDMLNFAYNCNQDLNSTGREPTDHCGPTITGCIDLRSTTHTSSNARDGFIIQDGAIPEVLSPAIQTLLETHVSGAQSNSYRSLRGTLARLKSWIFGPYTKNGSVKRTMVFLTMSHDEDQGTVALENDQVVVNWEGASKAGNRKNRILEILGCITKRLGGTLVSSPSMTVHPLGGAVMSSDGTGSGGVVSHRGELFAAQGEQLHKGVFCVDGSVVPTSLGVNPCATITALAERTCDHIVRERDWKVDENLNKHLNVLENTPHASHYYIPHPHPDGVRFDENMQGHIHIGSEITSFEEAETVAKVASSSASLNLRIAVRQDDHSTFVGNAHGTISCGALSQDPLLVTHGSIHFFTIDEDVSDAKNLVYHLNLMSTGGETFHFHGYKRIDPSITLSLTRTWRATTTLYSTITNSTGLTVARGILRLPLRAFIFELRSLYSLSNGRSCFTFLSFFACNIASYFLAPFRPLQTPQSVPETNGYYTKPVPKSITLTAKDGVTVPLKLWQPSPATPSKCTPLLFIPGAAVDEQIFSLPTIPVNTIDYFTALGYKCYVVIPRFGAGQVARHGYTAFDARLDVQATVEYVHEQENAKVYVMAHCLGSIATAMALLTGEVDVNWIAGMTVSQVFMHIAYSPDNEFKARRPWLIRLYETVSHTSWLPLSTSSHVRFLDTLLRFYPSGSPREICSSAVCHRCNMPFGRCWTHSNLNHATHLHLNRFFDGVHTHFLEHLSGMGATTSHHVRTNHPGFFDLVTPINLAALKGIKIAFLYGDQNAVWSRQATKASYDTLRAAFPDGEYDRIIIEGYGHLDCWMGKNAWKDVWPRVRRHISLSETAVENEFVCI